MKNLQFLLIPILLSGCSFNINTSTSDSSSSNKELNVSTFEVIREYDFSFITSEEFKDVAPLLLKSKSDVSYPLSDMKNLVAGDKVNIYHEGYMYYLTTYPCQLSPEGYSHYTVEEIDIYEFNLSIYHTDGLYTYTLTGTELNNTYTFNEKKIICSDRGDFINVNENTHLSLFNNMKVYGTLNEDNSLRDLYTFNPRVKEEKMTIFKEIELTFLERNEEKSIFANEDYLVETVIDNSELQIGDKYLFTYEKPLSLLDNSLKLQALITPKTIEEKYKFSSEDDVDVTFLSANIIYDGMPIIDESGNTTQSYKFMSSYFEFNHVYLNEPKSISEIINDIYGKPSKYYEIVNSINGLNYAGFNNKDYVLNHSDFINFDCTLYFNNTNEIIAL